MMCSKTLSILNQKIIASKIGSWNSDYCSLLLIHCAETFLNNNTEHFISSISLYLLITSANVNKFASIKLFTSMQIYHSWSCGNKRGVSSFKCLHLGEHRLQRATTMNCRELNYTVTWCAEWSLLPQSPDWMAALIFIQ